MSNANKVKELLERSLKARTKDLNERTTEEMAEDFNIDLEIADLTTIHEAYQFLVKKYVENAEEYMNENFLTMEEIKANHEKRKKKKGKGKGKSSKTEDMEVGTEESIKGRTSRLDHIVLKTQGH